MALTLLVPTPVGSSAQLLLSHKSLESGRERDAPLKEDGVSCNNNNNDEDDDDDYRSTSTVDVDTELYHNQRD
jgi:hypothetical protein